MKIGYPCTNNTIECSANKTFKIKSYTLEKIIETVKNNLCCLHKILEFNCRNGLMFFRISSDTVPFASHEVCQFDWSSYFKEELSLTGVFIKQAKMRISMHPGPFVVLNSPNKVVVENSIRELEWHCHFLQSLGLDNTAKVQIHLGGVYEDKKKAMERFINVYETLPKLIKKRLVVENDDRSYSLKDCLTVSEKTGAPILFDTLHHECLNNNESILEAMRLSQATWKEQDGTLMVDYSTQNLKGKKGNHALTLDGKKFREFLQLTKDVDFDIMLEIKDKEKSALEALKLLKEVRGI